METRNLLPVAVIHINPDILKNYCKLTYLCGRYEHILNMTKNKPQYLALYQEYNKKLFETLIQKDAYIVYMRTHCIPPRHQKKKFIPNLKDSVLLMYEY